MRILNINDCCFLELNGFSSLGINSDLSKLFDDLNVVYFYNKNGQLIINVTHIKRFVKKYWIDGEEPTTPTQIKEFEILKYIKNLLNFYGVKPENSIFAEGL